MPESLIRQRVQDWANALSAKDLGGVMSLYAPNIVSFDVDPPLRYAGWRANASLGHWQRCSEYSLMHS